MNIQMSVLGALLLSSEAFSVPLGYSLAFRLDGIGEPGVFGLTLGSDPFSGYISFSSPLAADLHNVAVPVQYFSTTIGNTTWDFQSLLGAIAYVSTDQEGLLTKIDDLTADTPSSQFSIIDASNVGWYAADKLAGNVCGFWPIGTVSGFCAFGGHGAVSILPADEVHARIPEPASNSLLLIGLGAALFGRHRKATIAVCSGAVATRD